MFKLLLKEIIITIMRAQNMVNRLDLYLGAQFIYIVGFGFPTIGSLMLGDPDAHSCFCKPFSFFHKVAPFPLDLFTLLSLLSLQHCQPPFLVLSSYL